MIAPTKMDESVPTISADEAADLIVEAIIERPSRIATRLGIFAGVLNAVMPKAYEVVMNTAFELFPDSAAAKGEARSGEHTSELQSLMRISYAVFCLTKQKTCNQNTDYRPHSASTRRQHTDITSQKQNTPLT